MSASSPSARSLETTAHIFDALLIINLGVNFIPFLPLICPLIRTEIETARLMMAFARLMMMAFGFVMLLIPFTSSP